MPAIGLVGRGDGPDDRCTPLLEKAAVDRGRQLCQRVVHVDDLVAPRSEQILLATVASLPRSHRNHPEQIPLVFDALPNRL
jgi:hypothetical protein